MTTKTKKLLSLTIFLLIIIAFAYYIYTHIGDFKSLTLANPLYIILLAIITLIGSTLIGMITDNLVFAFGVKLRFKEWFGLSITTSFYNIIFPFRGGMVSRAVYLNKKHDFSYSNFLAALAGTYVITFLIAAFLGLISLFLLYMQMSIFNPIVLLIFLTFFIPLLAIVIVSPKIKASKNKFINSFIKVINGWHLIHSKKRIVAIVSIIATLQLLLGALGYIVSYYIFAINISLAQAIFMASFGSFALLISITPAGLGITETISVFSGLVIGITPAQALTVAILNRAVTTTIMFILGPIFSYILLKHKSKSKYLNMQIN